MNPDPFEERLSRAPLRRPPEAWRNAILSAARAELRPPTSRIPTESASWFEAAWHALCRAASPLSALGAAAAVVVTLGIAGSRVDASLTASVPSERPAESRTAVIAAMRTYQTEVVQVANRIDRPDGEEGETGPAVPPPDVRPRSQNDPPRARGIADGSWLAVAAGGSSASGADVPRSLNAA